jgi:hypothetical protein
VDHPDRLGAAVAPPARRARKPRHRTEGKVMSDPITYVDGRWVDANAPLWSSMSHGVWLSSMIFDGARAFEGVMPDLDLHCQRAVRSAKRLGLAPTKTAEEIEEIAREGVAKFPTDEAVYIRPMFWADDGFVAPDPTSTRFALTVNPLPMPASTASPPACRPVAVRRPTARRRIPRRRACTLMPGARCRRPGIAASTTASCWTPWAMSLSSRRRTCSSPRTAC